MSAVQANDARYPEFSWDTVPIAFHFEKGGGLMTKKEAEFVASRSNFICLEKGHASRAFGGFFATSPGPLSPKRKAPRTP